MNTYSSYLSQYDLYVNFRTYLIHRHAKTVNISPLAGYTLKHVFRSHPSCSAMLCTVAGTTNSSRVYLDLRQPEIRQTSSPFPIDQYVRLRTRIRYGRLNKTKWLYSPPLCHRGPRHVDVGKRAPMLPHRAFDQHC